MKKKVLISIVAVALFGVAIAWNATSNEQKDVTVQNAEAIAGGGVVACSSGSGPCLLVPGSSGWINHLGPIVVHPE